MVIVDPHRLELGEGPGYDPASDLAWWFDIPQKRLYLRHLSQAETTVHELPFACSAMAVTRDGRQIVMSEQGLCWRDPSSGALTLHLAIEADNPITRSNDSRVHPSGAFWVSTMGWNAEPGAGSLYRAYRGEVEVLQTGMTIPNAICFSPDGRLAYFTDSLTKTIQRVETDPKDGRMAGTPRPFLTDLPGPDGAVTDADGNLWVANFGAGQVLGYAPDSSAIGVIDLPAPNLTCPAFVGQDTRQMLVTSATLHMTDEGLAQHPESGATFLLPISFTGRFDPPADL